jgi:hypothetical protein
LKEKNLTWEKPVLVYIGNAGAVAMFTKGENSIQCHDCLSGENTGGGLRCYAGHGVYVKK